MIRWTYNGFDNFKICPRTFWYCFFLEVKLTFLPFEFRIFFVTSLYWIECDRNDTVWFPRISHKRHYNFPLVLPLWVTLIKAKCHTMRILKQRCAEAHFARNRYLLPTVTKMSLEINLTAQLNHWMPVSSPG